MAVLSNSRRAAAGIALIIAGALFVLAVILPLAGQSFPWVIVLAQVALVIAFVILAIGAVNSTLTRVALIVAAVGWAILALAGLGIVALPAGVATFAAILAAAGGIVGAILLYTGREIANRSAIVFIVANVLGALYLLGGLGLLSLGTLGAILTVLFGAALILSGVLFRQAERRRR